MSLKSMPIDSIEREITTVPFHNACAEGNLSVVKYCLAQQGFDMHAGNEKGRTGFHFACFMGNLNVVQFFLQQGFNIYVGDHIGRTGFHLACYMGNLNVVQFLFQQGFDMYFVDEIGRTGFYGACFMGNLNVVQFMVQHGFDMNVSDNNGFTGFHVACTGGKLNKFLIQQGFKLHDKNTGTRFGNLNVVQFLLQQGFDMNVGDNNGGTGFHFACVCGNLNVVQFLLQQGFDMYAGDNLGSTGFIWACIAGNLNLIRYLLTHGFENINEFSIDRTALDILIDKRCDYPDDELYMESLILLIESGAKLSEDNVFEELISAIQNRIIEITFVKKIIFEKWTGRIAQSITNFTMDSFTNISSQNLSQFLDDQDIMTKKELTICSLF